MSWNPYPYALGNPVNYTDPSGRNPLFYFTSFATLVGIGAGLYNAGMNLLQQITENIVNGRFPLACINVNDLIDSFIDGFILGSGIILIAGVAVAGLTSLVTGIVGGLRTGFIFAGAIGGALLTGAENIKNQVDKIIAEGRADNFIDALSELDTFSLVWDMRVGGVAGGLLGVGNSAAWTALGAYILGFVLSNVFGTRSYLSPNDLSLVIIDSVILDAVDEFINPTRGWKKFASRFLTGAGSFALYSLFADYDSPLANDGEKVLFVASGLANAVVEFLPVPKSYKNATSNFIDAILNTLSFQWMK